MLQVWGRRSAFNVQKVMWLVGELGLQHEHIPAGGSFGIRDTPEFLRMNPHGRIPVVKDDEVIVWESHAILRYLAATYGGHSLWNQDPAVRSETDRWMDWAQCSLQTAFIDGVFWGGYRTPPHLQDVERLQANIRRCGQLFSVLNGVLADKAFLTGNTLTLADIAAGSNLYRYFELDIQRPSLPNVERWYSDLKERPAYQEHVMIPFSELRGRLDF
ncbi:glutathione S-transferase family protein [Pseudomonas putida]